MEKANKNTHLNHLEDNIFLGHIDGTREAIKFIRDAGIKIPIFLGGPYTTGDYQNALQDENIDLCLLGEGEKTLTDLVKRMINNNNKLPSQEELKEIPGIAFLQKPVYQNIEVSHKKNTTTKNLNL